MAVWQIYSTLVYTTPTLLVMSEMLKISIFSHTESLAEISISIEFDYLTIRDSSDFARPQNNNK